MKKWTRALSEEPESFLEQFSRRDLICLLVGILALILLTYVVIHYDIVSIETFTNGMSKYNVSNTGTDTTVGGLG